MPLLASVGAKADGQRPALYACENDHDANDRLKESLRGKIMGQFSDRSLWGGRAGGQVGAKQSGGTRSAMALVLERSRKGPYRGLLLLPWILIFRRMLARPRDAKVPRGFPIPKPSTRRLTPLVLRCHPYARKV